MNAVAIKDDTVYVLEVNPRASRTVPFVSKATGVPIAKLAAQVMAGARLADLGFAQTPQVAGFFVKEAVLPFRKFAGSEYRLGPEMRSTGEVMGHAATFGHAFAKAEMAAGVPLPGAGNALITVNDYDKGAVVKIARDLHRLGFRLFATQGTRPGCPGRPAGDPGAQSEEGHPNVGRHGARASCNWHQHAPGAAGARRSAPCARRGRAQRAADDHPSAATAAVNGITRAARVRAPGAQPPELPIAGHRSPWQSVAQRMGTFERAGRVVPVARISSQGDLLCVSGRPGAPTPRRPLPPPHPQRDHPGRRPGKAGA